ncbi:MAG: hypothetical protein DCF32_18205, partial [Leptolyngbya sp.]
WGNCTTAILPIIAYQTSAGNPPKVIWLRLGNCSTRQVEDVLRRDFDAIKLFYEDESLSLLALS